MTDVTARATTNIKNQSSLQEDYACSVDVDSSLSCDMSNRNYPTKRIMRVTLMLILVVWLVICQIATISWPLLATITLQVRQLTDKEQLVLKLESLYPAHIGVISAFFFNYMKLSPGEALYLGANEPHAYLSGECIECMAKSDNVVRAGLTPKHRDIQTLCSMLTYKQGFPEILKGFPLTPYVTRCLPPFDEFEVDLCILSTGDSTVFTAIPGPSIFLVLIGNGTIQTVHSKQVLAEGDVLFVPSNVEIHLTTMSKLQLYRAGINSKFYES